MSERDDGGPAFPSQNATPPSYTDPPMGMSLRDAFAIGALRIINRAWENEEGDIPDDIMQRWADGAYEIADAMLKARSK